MDRIPSEAGRYTLAILSVLLALGISSFLFRDKIEGVQFPLFIVAIALTVWYGRVGPAILAVANRDS